MRQRTPFRPALVMAASLMTLHFAAASVAAQVDAAAGEPFVGRWELELEAQGQYIALDVDIWVEEGMLAATVSGIEGGKETVEELDLEDRTLILTYETSAQGQTFPIELSLTPKGDEFDAIADVADGMFEIQGTAVARR